tara:strand:- start:12888 stop:13184 length:297 start_codon:yes stop_codon:yes gene_type:complete
MEIRFANDGLALIETDQAHKTRLPPNVIVSARRKLQFVRSATDERDLRNWKSLHYEKLTGDRVDQKSIRINDRWRLVFLLDRDANPNIITVLAIEDYH